MFKVDPVVYSVDDMRSIMHVGDIFWRYIK